MLAHYLHISGTLLDAVPQSLLRQMEDSARLDRALLIALTFLMLLALLMLGKNRQRARLRDGFAWVVLCLVLLGASSACQWFAMAVAAKMLHGAALGVGGVAIVNLLSVLLFDVGLKLLRPESPRILRDVAVGLGYVLILLWLLARAGVTLSSLVTSSAIVTAVLAFALQDTLGNIMGGLALQLEGTIRVGDWIRVQQDEGRVREIRWRYTSIETRNWDTIVIPNGMLMKAQVTVLGRRQGENTQHRQWVYFNVDFRVAPTKVLSIVNDALQGEPIECVASDPAAHCIIFDYKESYTQYAVRYWLTDLQQNDPANSRVRARIFYALQRAGITLSIPAQSVFVTEETVERKDMHQEREVARRVQALGNIELFQSLTPEELRRLAGDLRFAPFTEGEAMTREGATAHSLYVITRGTAEVLIATGEGERRRVAALQPGDFFGEIALMTGMTRSATVRALEYTECYRLDKEAFHDVLHTRPEIAEHISQVLARRRVELEAARENLDAEARARRLNYAQKDFFARITSFFGLGGAAKATSTIQ
jgi:small-conductance mechanosensitive channel/CRP-like cAMP-binding protein